VKCLIQNGEDSAFSAFERGELLPKEFEVAFGKELSEFTGQKVDVSGFVDFLESKITEPIPDAMEAIQTLKKLDYKIGILTNNWKTENGESFMMKDDLFDVVVESAKLGTRKPNRDIYEKIIGEMAVAPEELVFLDDIGKNLKAAKALGIQTIKVETGKPQKAIHALAEIIGKKLVDWPSTTTPLRPGLELDEQKLRYKIKIKK
jgi:acyl-CoA dehydrogenase family protein 10